jgi:EAL domain-containing protein (putative c-di-GMP-specific phosphodiesterase class I)/HAMP domain-containing protein/GGDEF domain-containing protein
MAFVITLLVATVISIYGTYRAKTMVEASNEAYINSLAMELALEMDNFIQLQKGYLEGQVNALTFTSDYSQENIAAFTYNMSKSNNFMLYSYFNTLTDSGHFTSSDGWIPPDGYSWENRYWVKIVSEMEDIFVDFPSYDAGTGNIVTVLRKRVFDREVKGILNMAINLDELSQKLKAFTIPSGGEAFLIDENGLLVAYHDPMIFVNQSKALTINDLIVDFEKEKSRFEVADMTFVAARLADAPWVLWVKVPASFFYNGVQETSFNFFLIYLMTLLISIVFALKISKKISTPIVKLKRHAELIGVGDYSQEISSDLIHQNDEIGQFATVFQMMRESILERESELEHNYQEIQALYEEMAASEETLRENYEELNLYKDKVEYYAFHNAQTGFYNRDYLIQSLNKRIQNDDLGRKALICLSYKEHNHYSETVGQTILELIHYKLGLAISEHISHDESTQIFDLANGKYALLISEQTIAQIDKIISAINDEVAVMKVLEAMMVKISVAVGGYILCDDVNIEDQGMIELEKSESALLRNQLNLSHEDRVTWFDSAMHQKQIYETQIETGLFEAISRNEIAVAYQPQYDRQGTIIGVEALMRWKHGKLGNIPPIEFIPRAESLGVIDQLDQFMISEVIKFQSEMKLLYNIILPISVNISVVELLDPQFIDRIEFEVMKFDIDRSALIFELTETAFSRHLSLVKDNIVKLMALGYQVHLDDFGTGYSSLKYLSEFPVSAIKIDRSFVSTFLENPKVANVISTMIDLAEKIETQIIAEGVETSEQLTGLIDLGCYKYQGFLFSKPIDREALLSLVLANKK